MVILAQDDFLFHVIQNESPYIDVLDSSSVTGPSSGQVAGPDTVIAFVFVYRGGLGKKRGASWSIFVYERSDTDLIGTASEPEGNMPRVYDIIPRVPNKSRPRLVDSGQADLARDNQLLDAGIFSRLDSNGELQLFWVGSFKLRTPQVGPEDGNIDPDTESVQFTGQAQILGA